MPKRPVIVALAWLAAANAFAGTNQWTQVGEGGGGWLFAVQHLPGQPGTALAGGVAGLYRTENNAQSWASVLSYDDHRNFPSSIAVNPVQTDVVLVASYRLYRSTDGGKTFVRAGSFPDTTNGSPSAIAFSRDGTVAWLGTDRGFIYRSDDGGVTWQLRTTGFTGLNVRALEVDAADKNVAYALTTSAREVYRTENGGASWSYISLGDRYVGITASPTTPNFVLGLREDYPYRSVNRGTSWMISTLPGHYVARYAPGTPGRIVTIGQGQHAFVSTDDGLFWIPQSSLPIAHALSISIDPLDVNRILVSTALGIAASTDGGSTWSTPNAGITEKGFGILLPALDGSDRMFVSAFDADSVHARDASTGKWTGVGAQSAAIFGIPNSSPFALALDPKDSARLYMSRNGRFGVSTDRGVTWSDVGLVQATFLAPDRVNSDVMYAVTGSGIRKTVNGGAIWNASSTGLGSVSVAHVVIDPNDPNVLYAGSATTTPAGVYKSIDAGAHWAPANGGIADRSVAHIAIDPRTPTKLYAATSLGAMKSVDGGASWQDLQPSTLGGAAPVVEVIVDPANPDSVYTVYDFGEVFRSVGSQQKWEFVGRVIPQPSLIKPTSLALVPGRPGVLTLATEYSGLLEYTIAPDLELTSSVSALAVEASQSIVLRVRNLGTHAASRVNLAATLPTNTPVNSVQPTVGSCNVSGQQLSCNLDALMSGESAEVTLSLGTVSGTQPLSASLRAYESDPKPQNNDVSLSIERRSDLRMKQFTSSFVQSPQGRAFVGNRVVQLIDIENIGPTTATSVRTTMQLPTNLAYESAPASSGNCSASGSTVTCEIASLAPGASATVTVNVQTLSAGDATSTASVTSSSVDPIPDNNSLSNFLTVTDSISPNGGDKGGGGRLDMLVLLALLLALSYTFVQSIRLRAYALIARPPH